jgi:hypothetical protein
MGELLFREDEFGSARKLIYLRFAPGAWRCNHVQIHTWDQEAVKNAQENQLGSRSSHENVKNVRLTRSTANHWTMRPTKVGRREGLALRKALQLFDLTAPSDVLSRVAIA